MEGIIYRKIYDDDGAIISLDGKTGHLHNRVD